MSAMDRALAYRFVVRDAAHLGPMWFEPTYAVEREDGTDIPMPMMQAYPVALMATPGLSPLTMMPAEVVWIHDDGPSWMHWDALRSWAARRDARRPPRRVRLGPDAALADILRDMEQHHPREPAPPAPLQPHTPLVYPEHLSRNT